MKMQHSAEARADTANTPLVSLAVQRGSALSKTAALQNAVQNSLNLAIIATDETGLIQVFNVGAERMLGYRAAEAVNKMDPGVFRDSQEAIAHAEALSAELGTTIAPGFEALTAKVLRGIADKYELTLVRKDGSRFPALLSIMALRDNQAKIIGYLLIGTDVSLLKRGTEAAAESSSGGAGDRPKELERNANAQELLFDLKDSEKLCRQLTTSIPQALWIHDIGANTLRYINPTWKTLTGRQVVAGDGVDRLYAAFHPDDVRQVLTAMKEFPNGGIDVECRILRPDGIVRWVQARTFPIADADDKVYRVAGVLDDITDRKKKSERVERLKDEFVSTVSHELRTPLTSIVGSLGLLIGNAAGNLPDAAVRLLVIAHNNSQRLVRLVGDILDIEKIEADKVTYDLERVEVRSLVQISIEAMRGFAASYGVRIRLDDTSATGDVCADPDRLVQVFTNLLSNAVKFSPNDAEVAVTIEKRNNMVITSVRDHGQGIPEDFKSHIFEKFAQAHATDARQLGGTGLGLSIAHQIVARLGGEVSFDNAPGGGAIFQVKLPDWDYLGKTKSIVDGRSDGARILLCEDDRDVAVVLCERLWQAGFATDIAYTPAEAAERTAAATYAAILVDLQLPDGDGISLIKQLRAQPQCDHTLLVVASADPSRTPDTTRTSTMLNILDWLDKPVDADRLVRVLDRLIVRGTSARPRILHVDDDHEMNRIIAQTLNTSAEVMSVASIDEARRALAANRFDVAVLNVALAGGAGLDLLLELHDIDGDTLPVIVFSAQDADTQFASRIYAGLTTSRASVDSLVATLRRHVAGRPLYAPDHTGKDVA